jgi:hypothetical protein
MRARKETFCTENEVLSQAYFLSSYLHNFILCFLICICVIIYMNFHVFIIRENFTKDLRTSSFEIFPLNLKNS